MQKSRTILVTGGAGFIGSNLIKLLVENPKNRVYSLDDYSTGLPSNRIVGVSYITGHTCELRTQEQLVEVKPELVFHLGEYSRVEKSFEDIPLVWRSNVNGTFSVLEFCRATGAKLIYAGSSTKFCDGGAGRNQSPYAWTKASNVDLIQRYGVWFGLKYAIAYFYNVYGPGEISTGGFATVIGIFKERSRLGKTLQVVSPGTQVRNFTHVDDIVRGLELIGEKGMGDNYALGADEGYTILQVARMFGGEIEMLPSRPGNRLTSVVVQSRARAELGWHPTKQLKDHIDEFMQSLQFVSALQHEPCLSLA